MNKSAVILINVGTPDTPEVKSVRRYLTQFLNDRRVIDLPWLLQKILVNLLIVPFRAKKSAKLYQTLWNENGSPLMYYTRSLSQKLQVKLAPDVKVFSAMRYGEPSLGKLLADLENKNYSQFIFIPLFPQYASSTTGSVIQLINETISKWNVIPNFRIVNQFYNNPSFIECFGKIIEKYEPEKFDHVIFTFHGLPLRQVQKCHPKDPINTCPCESYLPEHGLYCYKATCYETARLLAARLNLKENSYSVAFQSRLTKDWLSPFTDKVLISKAKSGVKEILLIAPSFVTDCLETLNELELEYAHLFKEKGGNNHTLVHSLNDSDEWVDALKTIIFG